MNLTETSKLCVALLMAHSPSRDLDIAIMQWHNARSTSTMSLDIYADPYAWTTKTGDKLVPTVRFPVGNRAAGDVYCPRYTANIAAVRDLLSMHEMSFTLEYNTKAAIVTARVERRNGEYYLMKNRSDCIALLYAGLMALDDFLVPLEIKP